jgi:hypothetical protein
MANEMVQGLLQNLLQPTQGPSPADIMAAISSRNPMASVAAMQAPQLSQMFGQQFRGLVGGLTGRPAPLTANEAYTAAVQQLSAQPDFMNSSASLAQLAKAASAVGRTQEAMQFSLLASQAREQEAAKAKLEAEKNKGLTMQSLARNTNIAAVDQAIASIPDATKYPGLSNALEGLRNQYATESEPSSPDKVQSTVNNLFTRYKLETKPTEQFQFQAEWDAWKQGQAPGASTTYADFLKWKEGITRQDSEYEVWKKNNPQGSIEDYWKAKERAQAQGRTAGTGATGEAITTPTERETELAKAYLTRTLGTAVNPLGFGIKPGIPAKDMGQIAELLVNEAAKLKKESGGTIQDKFQTALVNLRNSGAISYDAEGNVQLTAPVNPLSTQAAKPADDFYR